MSDRDLDFAPTVALPGKATVQSFADATQPVELTDATSRTDTRGVFVSEPAPISLGSLLSLGATFHQPIGGGPPPDADFLRQTAYRQRYQDRGQLGEGGMGEVRLSRDVVVGREVAIKTIRSEIEEVARERFLREARVQGQLEHPSVVPIYDLGLTEERRLFFTMKRVRGETLDAIVNQLAFEEAAALTKYPQRRLLAAFVQLCLAIEYAHSRGVLHRDLKPANVMLGDFGEVNVLDWGLAKVGDASEARESVTGTGSGKGATLDGSVLGTPGYMAPEQAAGKLDHLDARTDVYALGTILYELLALEPFHGQTTLTALMAAAFAAPNPPLEARASIERIPPELLVVVHRATALLPTDRMASARELGDAVERYLDGERDELRRRELAEGHVEQARAFAKVPSSRVEALREVGRAIALDPTNAPALALLNDLFVQLPDETPREAEPELAALERERRGGVLWVAGVRSLLWMLAAPFFFYLGVTSPWRFVTMVTLVLVNAAVAYTLYRKNAATEAGLLVLLALSTLCVTSFSWLYGPLVLVPAYAVSNAITYALGGGLRLRVTAIVLSIASLVVPILASYFDLITANFYTSDGGGTFTVHSSTVLTPLHATVAVLFAAFVATTITPTMLIGRLTDRLAAAERRVTLQAFHLRQLLPRPRE